MTRKAPLQVQDREPRKHESGTRPAQQSGETSVEGYIIREPQTPEEYLAMHRMRAQEYVRMGSFRPEDCPNGFEIDAYDPMAKHFIACFEENVIGTLRITHERQGTFLMERDPDGFTLPTGLLRRETCEPSRLVGKSFYHPQTGLRVSQYPWLFFKACEWSFLHGKTFWVMALMERLYAKLVTDGWPIVDLGPSKWYHGVRAYPVLVSVPELRSKIFNRT